MFFGGHFVFGGHFFFKGGLRAVKIELHAKSGACSSKIERVMLNLVFARKRFPPPPPVTSSSIELRASRQLTTKGLPQ